MACGILVLQPGMKPVSPALEAWSLKHWTTREILIIYFLFFLPMLSGLRDLSSLTRDQTHAPCNGKC